MTTLEDLLEIKANLVLAIKTATASPKPNYSIDGQSVSWSTYLDSLWAKLNNVNAMIAAEQPFEIVSRGVAE